MARAASQRQQPRYDEPLEAPRPRPRAPRRRSRPAARDMRAYLPRHLFVFIALLALVGAGRVTLSFAVVQKSLQTGAVIHQERALAAESAQLSERIAALTATGHVRGIAINKLHLVPATNVQYLTIPRKPAKPAATGR